MNYQFLLCSIAVGAVALPFSGARAQEAGVPRTTVVHDAVGQAYTPLAGFLLIAVTVINAKLIGHALYSGFRRMSFARPRCW